MLFGRQNRGINTDVSRRAWGRQIARAVVSLGTVTTCLTLSQSASAVPVISLRFASVTVTADGINPTPVVVLAQVVNGGTAVQVNSLSAEYSVVASGTLDATALTLTSGTVSNPGVFTLGAPNFTVNAGGWGVDQNPTPTNTLASGTSNIATLVYTIPAGVSAGTYTISFLTELTPGEESPLRSFTNTTTDPDTLYAYADGNNGTTFGVITVVPEPSTGTALATATLLMAGVGIAQRRMRRRDGTSELVA